MKKQVKFAENWKVDRLLHDEAFPRIIGMNQSKMALKDVAVNFDTSLKIKRPPAARKEPQLQQLATIQIPKTMTTAPFLKHAALTPAQKEYLYTISASHSPAHVRGLITQHYMNVLHRCIRAGHSPDRYDLVVTSVSSPEHEREKHQSTTQSEISSTSKQKAKVNASARRSRKSFLPNIPNRKVRPFNTSESRQGKIQKRGTTPQTQRRNSPRKARIRLLEEEEGPDDSLSECLSCLSMLDWDDDNFSDL
ncbi:protein FAM216A [Brachyistius frenatus]|uniref:protein FAM216A n=1 Tax=Brachyistius frenatus TaxID=100188 RepID=UPI0037E9627B